MHIINAFVHSQKTFAHSFSLFPPRVFSSSARAHAHLHTHTQQHRAVTAFSLQQCHAEMRGPHLVQKTTEISLRTRITTVLLVCLPLPPPHPFFPFPHFLSFSRSLLAISPSPSSNSRFFIFYRVPPELFKVAATIWVIQLSPISTRHAHTYTRVQSHTSPSVYYLTLPGGRDSITELNSDPVSTAWPEKRDVCGACASLCVEERTETE